MRKYIILGVVAALVGVTAWKYFTTGSASPGQAPAARTVVAVETDRIRKADLGDRVVFTGSVKAEERYDAAPKIAGIIRQVNFNVGDSVHRGDVLAILDDDEHRLEVDQAAASLRVAEANANDAESQLRISERDFVRAETLVAQKVISAQEYDRYDAALKAQEAKYETALAQVRLAEAVLKSAQVKLGYTRVVAEWNEGPDERVIGQRFMDAGALATVTTPILSVLDIRTVRAVISVSEKEYPKISLGDHVAITTDAFPGKVFMGRVSRIPQELGAFTREAEVEVAVDNKDLHLKPGMFVRADIEFRRRYGAAAAPLEAVVRRDDGRRGVYLVNPDRTQVSFQPVVEGIVDGNWVELVDGGGLMGREVVVLGQHLLKDGITIRVAGERSNS